MPCNFVGVWRADLERELMMPKRPVGVRNMGAEMFLRRSKTQYSSIETMHNILDVAEIRLKNCMNSLYASIHVRNRLVELT